MQNRSNRDVNKIVIQLEKATIVYAFSPASTRIGSADTLRIPDYCERRIAATSIFKSKSDVVPAHTEVLRTCRIEVPTGLASVDTGKIIVFVLVVSHGLVWCCLASDASSLIHPLRQKACPSLAQSI